MKWIVFLIISALFLSLGFISAYCLSKKASKNSIIKPLHLVAVSTLLSAFILFLPISFEQGIFGLFKTIFLSLFYAMQLFGLNGDFGAVTGAIANEGKCISVLFSVYSAFIFAFAPILTFRFILSFFKSFDAYKKYIQNFNKDIYLFSELNQKSLVLAEDVRKQFPAALIIFTDVFPGNEEDSFDFLYKAKELKSICIQKDIKNVRLRFHKQGCKIVMFFIGENETENVEQALCLIEIFRDTEKVEMYVFAKSVESEFVLDTVIEGKIMLRRINETRALVYDTLYEKSIFDNANITENKKIVSVLIIGLGHYGFEFLKAIAWCGQMDGYELEINAIDKKPGIESKIKSLCPELMEKNNIHCAGDGYYNINIIGDMDTESYEFTKFVESKINTTQVFIALGNDDTSIEVAVKLRMLFERRGKKPIIHAVVQNPTKTKVLDNEMFMNFKGQHYNIDLIGDITSQYSLKTITSPELEDEAKKVHMHWVDFMDEKARLKSEKAFDNYEYNRRSSMAMVIHMKYRDKCDIIDKAAVKLLEHKRWNVYMRTEGYSYSGSTEESSRNDLAKLHNDIVPYNELSSEEAIKDSIGLSDKTKG